MKFGTILADPPWDYQRTSRQGDAAHKKLSGYSDMHYAPLTTSSLCDLPVGDLARDDSVLLLWTTWPFVPAAVKVMESWGFKFVTGLPWVKVTASHAGLEYGVGYWFRGCTEPLLVGRRQKSYRTNMQGILTGDLAGLAVRSLGHSRKPQDVYHLAEAFPGPYLELFARGDQRPGWHQCGDEHEWSKGEHIAESIQRLCVMGDPVKMPNGGTA